VAEESVVRHGAAVGSVAFSTDGKILASLGSGARKFWDSATGHEIAALPTATIGGTSLAFSGNGRKLLTNGGPNFGIEVWDETGRREALLQGHTAPVDGIAISPDGRMLASASQDQSIILWDLGSRRVRHTVKVGRHASVVAFSPDGKTLALGAQFGVVKLIDTAMGREVATP